MPTPFALLNYFLNSGDFGAFSEEEKWLARNVFSTARDELNIDECYDFDDEDDTAFKEKIEATMKNFKLIIRLFKDAEKARSKYGKKFPKWSPLRLDNIGELRLLAGKINTDRLNCNISKITATCTSVLGAIVLGASFAFPPAAPILAPAGLGISSLGGATVFGTSITEITLLKKNMNEAQDVIKKDEVDFKEVGTWFKHSQDIIDAFESVMGFSVASKLFEDLKNFAGDIREVANLINGKVPSGLETIIRNCVRNLNFGMGLLSPAPSIVMALTPIAISFFVVIVLMRKNNGLIFDSVVLSHRIAFGLMRILDLGGDLGALICAAAARAGGAAAADVSANTARVVAHGVFAGIGLALDLTNLVFASVDIHKGSISPYATQLTQAADHLEREHEVLLKIYEELFLFVSPI